MKYKSIFDRREAAGRFEILLYLASGVGVVTAVFVALQGGLLAAVVVLLLAVVLFALARLIDLLAEILGTVGRLEEGRPTADKQKTGETV